MRSRKGVYDDPYQTVEVVNGFNLDKITAPLRAQAFGLIRLDSGFLSSRFFDDLRSDFKVCQY